jgi:RNA polymerase sigma-70 factor (ECF subfamily)
MTTKERTSPTLVPDDRPCFSAPPGEEAVMEEPRLTPAQQRDLVQRLFLERVPELRRFVTATLPDIALVDEVIQQTFKAITADAPFYDPTQSFTVWLHPVVRHAVATVGRQAEPLSQPFSEDVIDSLMASRPGATDIAALRRWLDECVQQLAPQARKIVELRYRKAMKPREVAKLMGWTNASVHVALSRARTALRECVDLKKAALDAS